MKALFLDTNVPGMAGRIRARLTPDVDLQELPSADERDLIRVAADAELLVRFRCPVDAAVFRAAPNATFMQQIGAGYDNMDLAAARAAGVRIANTPGANAGAVAEHAVLLMLAAVKRLIPLDRHTRAGRFGGAPGGRGDLAGSTVGLVGLGSIGTAIAERLFGFGPRLVYTQRHRADAALEARLGLSFLPFRELLRQTNVLSLQVPLSDETRGLIGDAELAAMPAGSYLVNVSRGGIVDEAALRCAVESGHLAGAALDVLEHEVDGGNPFADLENVIVTPHIAGGTPAAVNQIMQMVADNLVRVARGGEPLYLIPEAS